LHVKPHALCDSYWDSFLEQLPVLENLNKDAAYILKNDPANSIEEVYLAWFLRHAYRLIDYIS
jgi:serine O-acetyltransferase